MPLEIPITFNIEKIEKFFRKILPPIGWAVWIGAIVYFFYRYSVLKNEYSLILAMVLVGMLLREIYEKWKGKRR